MFCQKCGAELNENAVFCGNCGARIEILQENNTVVEDSSDIVADNQDEIALDNQGEVTRESQPAEGNATKKKIAFNMDKNTLIPLIASIAVVIIAAIIILVPKFSNKQAEVNNNVVIEEQEVIEEPVEETNVNKIDSGRIRSIINQYSDYTDFGIYVHNLKNGYKYGYNGDSVFLASAMCQVVILDTLSRTVEENSLDIDYEEMYFSYIPNGKEAPTSRNESDTYLNLRKYVEDVAVYGDNNKSNHIVDYIGQVNNVHNGFDVINNTLRRNGYKGTKINRKTFINPDYIDNSVPANTTTPSEIAEIFENLVNHGSFGNKNYMMNIFKSVSLNGQPIGLKKCVPAYYDICNVNALNDQSTNNVAIIGDGNTEIVVAILSTTDEFKTNVENNEDREVVIAELMNYILDTQFNN